MKAFCFSVAVLIASLTEFVRAAPGPEHYVNVSFLDELKKNGLVDKLYK